MVSVCHQNPDAKQISYVEWRASCLPSSLAALLDHSHPKGHQCSQFQIHVHLTHPRAFTVSLLSSLIIVQMSTDLAVEHRGRANADQECLLSTRHLLYLMEYSKRSSANTRLLGAKHKDHGSETSTISVTVLAQQRFSGSRFATTLMQIHFYDTKATETPLPSATTDITRQSLPNHLKETYFHTK